VPIEIHSLARQKLILWLSILLIAAVSALSFYSSNRLIALSERAERTQAILGELNRFMSDLQGIETGARGYVITGDPNFLAPQKTGAVETDRTLRRLRALANGDRPLRRKLDRMEALSRQRIVLAEALIARRARGLQAPALIPALEEGKAGMDQIRREVGSTFAAEAAGQRQHELDIERQVLLTNGLMVAGVVASLGLILWLFAIRGREIGRRRRAEDELKALNAELEDRVEARTAEVERSHELLDAVIENMPATVALKDITDNGRYVLFNRAGERLLGMDRADVIGRVDCDFMPHDQAERLQEEDLEVVASGETRFFAERVVATTSGDRIVESHKIPISGTNGGHRYVLVIGRDLTEQRATESQLRQIQRMDAVGRLTGGIAHDFNNILAIILGNIDLLREQQIDGTEGAEMADEALAAATHGAELVRRLLAFARMQHLEPTALDLNRRLPAITALLKRTLGERVTVRVNPVEGLWPALVDPTQVDDALVNLAINARDAMPDGGALTIETGNETLDEDYAVHHVEVTPGDYVMLAVSDTGTGMEPAVIARAFEPFFTTKDEGQGTGLGLSQVYGWVKQSGGHIKIYSELGHGTTIKLYLPRADAPRDEAANAPEAIEAALAGNETVLVVEDNPKVRSTVLRQLRDLGYSTLEAGGGEAALDLVRSPLAFDLLLTDVVMPGGMTGYELARQARALRPELRVLFTSGYTELAAASGQPAATGPLLSKPYRKADLARALRAVLDEA